MPATDSPRVIVARFLKANHYYQTLDAFLLEAGLSEDVSETKLGDWTIEKILEEKQQFDTSLQFEKKANEGTQGWSTPAPTYPNCPNLPSLSNVLFVTTNPDRDKLLTTHADKALNLVHGHVPYAFHESYVGNDSPILCVVAAGNSYLLSTSMSGQLAVRDAITGGVRSQRRDHLKMAVQVAFTIDQGHWLVATAGWDQKVLIYTVNPDNLPTARSPDEEDVFGEPKHTISLPTVPESLIFVRHPDTAELYLILSRRDSSFLYYHKITLASDQRSPKLSVSPSGRQNLAPHSNAWVAFSPSCLSISPKDPTLIAVATSHLPHMKLIVVRLLFPSEDGPAIDAQYRAPADAARASLALQDREDAAISLHVTTMASQTPYSTPRVVWRPDASGVWVNGDDGVIRGLEVKTGKVVTALKGHEPASKVRTLWAGYLKSQAGEEREVLVSGGFDKQVLIWDCDQP